MIAGGGGRRAHRRRPWRRWAPVIHVLLVSVAAASGCVTRGDDAAPPPPRTREVRLPVASADGPFVLAGTLALPTTNTSAVPAVLVLGGSGSQDRDGARADLAGYRPWRELADTLTARGIAVLRLDDRGTGASTGQFVGTTTQGFADDARVALGWLRKQADIDPARVAMVGHSEGALVALLTARADTAVAALVLMGAPSRSGREIARWQRQRVVAGDLAAYPPSERDMVLARADRDADALAASDPWLRDWFALDPRVVASGVHRPVLLLHGETDQQVPVAQAGELAAVLRRAGAPVAEERFARTNHLFLPDDDGDPSGYVRLVERRMRPAALRAAARFLEGVFTAR